MDISIFTIFCKILQETSDNSVASTFIEYSDTFEHHIKLSKQQIWISVSVYACISLPICSCSCRDTQAGQFLFDLVPAPASCPATVT